MERGTRIGLQCDFYGRGKPGYVCNIVSMEGRNQDTFSQDREIKEGRITLEGSWMLSSNPCEGLSLHPCQPLHAGRSLPGLATQGADSEQNLLVPQL